MIDADTFRIDHAGLSLQGYHWPSNADSARAAIVIVHGLGEHSGRYDHVGSYFIELGYEVFAFDHEGHGNSEGKRGAIRNWPMAVASINSALAAIRQRLPTPHLPVVLYGHSLGGLYSLDYLTGRAEAMQLTAAVVTSPPLALSFTPSPWLVKAANTLKRIAPNVTKSNELDATALSQDAGVVSMYQVDPLVHDQVSILLGADMLTHGKRLTAAGYHGDVPLLLMHGTKDGVTHPGGTSTFAEASTGPVSLELWDGGYHELHNEPYKEQVLHYIAMWLDHQVPTA